MQIPNPFGIKNRWKLYYFTFITVGLLRNRSIPVDGEDTAKPITYDDISKSDRCKIRYLAGWTLFKVLQNCNDYWKKNAGSKSTNVQQRVRRERNIASLAKELTTSRDAILRTTTAPDSMDEIEQENRGGLIHVLDETYVFFVKLELCCSVHFTDEAVARYNWDTLKVARKLVRDDPSMKIEWHRLMSRVTGIYTISMSIAISLVLFCFYGMLFNVAMLL